MYRMGTKFIIYYIYHNYILSDLKIQDPFSLTITIHKTCIINRIFCNITGNFIQQIHYGNCFTLFHRFINARNC